MLKVFDWNVGTGGERQAVMSSAKMRDDQCVFDNMYEASYCIDAPECILSGYVKVIPASNGGEAFISKQYSYRH